MSTEKMVRVPESRLRDIARDLRDLASADYPATPIEDQAILQIFSSNGEPALGGAGATFNEEQALKAAREILSLLPVDPAEVERLRDENRRLHEAGEFLDGVNQGIEDTLRAQLAERDALLHSLDCAWNSHDGKERFGKLMRKVETLAASAEPSAPPEQSEWRPLTAPGQIQEGDRLSFRVGSSFICARARQIIASGTDKEEVVYNRKKNHYFLTSMAVDGTSSHKNVMVARVTA